MFASMNGIAIVILTPEKLSRKIEIFFVVFYYCVNRDFWFKKKKKVGLTTHGLLCHTSPPG